MTRRKNSSNGDSNNGKHHHEQDLERIAAELLDRGGQVISIGEAELALKNVAYFYPRDPAPLRTIQSRATTLFLSDSNESLGIVDVEDCPEDQPEELMHFHLQLR
ncbi:MAG TPA: hypothetical protein VH369_26040 [Bryobacteraceae bacterium]|jgi:hypothetical protein